VPSDDNVVLRHDRIRELHEKDAEMSDDDMVKTLYQDWIDADETTKRVFVKRALLEQVRVHRPPIR